MANAKTIALLFVALGVVTCALSCSNNNGCEDALNNIKSNTQTVCSEDGYKDTAFCRVCVPAGLYSTSGPTDCVCKLLAFDQPYCTYPGDQEGLAGVRGAIEWANANCASLSLPDAGRETSTDAAVDAASDVSEDAQEGGED